MCGTLFVCPITEKIRMDQGLRFKSHSHDLRAVTETWSGAVEGYLVDRFVSSARDRSLIVAASCAASAWF